MQLEVRVSVLILLQQGARTGWRFGRMELLL